MRLGEFERGHALAAMAITLAVALWALTVYALFQAPLELPPAELLYAAPAAAFIYGLARAVLLLINR
ncbi:MAG: hypothetical protein GC152_01400 [Alphaproteobacteria bacterium]|nr:hypothetical protein [Alphaproteobacteria bacterium]